MRAINGDITALDAEVKGLEEELSRLLMRMPNILHASVPVGDENVPIRTWGSITPPTFAPKSHVDIIESLGLADLERAAKVAGARFYYLKRDLVLLDYALMQFAMEYLHGKGYQLIEPPT
jgi:seryl-tRNA synthetase